MSSPLYRYRLEINNNAYEIEITQKENYFEILVDGEIFNSNDLIQENTNIKINSIGNHEEYSVSYNNYKFEVHLHQRRDEKKKSKSASEIDDYFQNGKILAPMPGKIVSVKCNQGDKVNKGQELIIFEAMKMKNYFTSPVNGIVTKVNVKDNDSVATKEILLEINEID